MTVEVDLRLTAAAWERTATLAAAAERAGFSGLVLTETGQAPWTSLAIAARNTRRLALSTGIAVAFARSPMLTAQLAWELAEGSAGRFRLGLGSQVRAHVQRRYGAAFDPPGPRMADYVEAVRDCLAAFRGDAALDHHGPYYSLSLLPPAWCPRRHPYGDVKIDVAAVNPWMCRMAARLADGVHVHPLHSPAYLRDRLLPALADGAAEAGRAASQIELTVPVYAVPEARGAGGPLTEQARAQLAFYGATRNYAFQFDDLGFEGTSARLNEHLKAGDEAGMAALVTDEMLAQFAVLADWNEIADALVERYRGLAARLVLYLAEPMIDDDPAAMGRWGEIARAVRSASTALEAPRPPDQKR